MITGKGNEVPVTSVVIHSNLLNTICNFCKVLRSLKVLFFTINKS